jgi:beta-glucosidase
LDNLMVRIADHFSNRKFFNLTDNNDFLAVDYYFHHRLKFPATENSSNKTISDLGWEIYPEGIYHILKDYKKFNLPIFITENGLADADDTKREKFIKDHLYYVHKAIQEGLDVRGYFYWSLLDNFEWDKGFWPRFGLVEIDYKTLERKIRPSALEYKKICETNTLIL